MQFHWIHGDWLNPSQLISGKLFSQTPTAFPGGERPIITRFRKQLTAALKGERHNVLFEQASPEIKGNLRSVFDVIDRDRSGEISTSTQEMNVAIAIVGEAPLSTDEIAFLRDRTGGEPLTWNRFIEMLLVT